MIVLSIVYIALILLFISKLFFYKKVTLSSPDNVQSLSIIIPFKNEEKNLDTLLASLSKQITDFKYEVILVNDGSTDNFQPIIDKYGSLVKLIHSPKSEEHLTSKQIAIDYGVECASYDWLVFTDADMAFDPNWLTNLVAGADKKRRPFIFGRTQIIRDNSVLNFVQYIQLEYLFATAWLFSTIGLDSSCMGNNILISKELYNKIGGQKGIGYTIVEDKKLLSKVEELGYTATPANPFTSFAFTYSVPIKSYFNQLIRWLKGGIVASKQILAVIAILGGELLAFMYNYTHNSTLLTISNGIAISVSIILFAIVFYKIKPFYLFLLFPLFLLILSIEAIIILPALLFIKPNWKGKKI